MTAHTNVKKHWLERHVTRLHGMHHFRDFTRWYHVNPGGKIIDRMMGTAITNAQLRSQSRAEFLATLGLAPNDRRLMAARHRFADKYSLSEKDIALASKT